VTTRKSRSPVTEVAGRLNKRWQPAELKRLKQLLGQRKTHAEIADIMERSLPAVGYAVRRIGVQRPARRWTKADDARLRELWVPGLDGLPSDDALASAMGRGARAIKARRLTLDLRRRPGWLTAEVKLLRRMWRANKPDQAFIDEAAKRWPDRPRRTIAQVRARRAALGLVRGHSGIRIKDYATDTLINEIRRRGLNVIIRGDRR